MMDSDALKMEVDNLSANKCVFCNELLKGKSKMLECLHFICNNCMQKSISSSKSIQCKCLSVTKELIDMPELPVIPSMKICTTETCNSIANKVCITCIHFYCTPCSKVHLSNVVNNVECHYSNSMQDYPAKTCMKCLHCTDDSDKQIQMCCTDCSVFMCCMCFLQSHQYHKYKSINDFNNEIKTNLSLEKTELKKFIDNYDMYLNKTGQHLSQLQHKKVSIYQQIDLEMDKLHKEIDKRTIELKDQVNNFYLEFDKTINENKQIIQNVQKENIHFMGVTEHIMKYDNNLYEVDNVVKIVSNKLKRAKHHTLHLASQVELKLEADFGFKRKKSMENCISTIQSVGSIIPYPGSRLSNIMTSNSKNSVQYAANNITDENIETDNDLDFDVESWLTSHMQCTCCDSHFKRSKGGITCNNCSRNYHWNCHLPPILKTADSLPDNWTCTMCENSTKYSKVLNLNTSIGVNERNILQRIIMELYCNSPMQSSAFRECPKRDYFPRYYEYVLNPVSLNDIRKCFQSDKSYESLTHVIKELYRVFQNPISYYSQNHPDSISAKIMIDFLNKMLDKWIPQLDKTSFQVQ